MLVKGLLDLLYNLLELILFVELPSLPDSFIDVLSMFEDYVLSSFGIIVAFIGDSGAKVLSVIITVIISANLFYMAWSLVFWILRKIPMLNIKE